LSHLNKVLEENNPEETDVVVISVSADCPDAESENPNSPHQVINSCQTEVFSKVVYAGEKAGKLAKLIAVPGKKIYELIPVTANRLLSSRVVISLSERVGAEEQAREIAEAWERLPRPELRVEIVPDGEETPWRIQLGRHLVMPSAADQDLAHRIWWKLSRKRTDGKILHEAMYSGLRCDAWTRTCDPGMRNRELTLRRRF
jgi:hypothetical protein